MRRSFSSLSCMHFLPATPMLTREKRNEILEKEKVIASGESVVVAVAKIRVKPQVPGPVKLVGVIKPGSFGSVRFAWSLCEINENRKVEDMKKN